MIKQDIKILSFDLGALYGYAYSAYNRSKNRLTVIKADTINLNKYVKNVCEFSGLCTPKRQRFMVFEQQLIEILNTFQVNIFASEDVFVNPHRVNAYTSLLIYLDTLERLVVNIKKQPLYKIAPRLIKSILTGSGEADKITVQQSLINNPNIVFRKNAIVNKMTSHSADAIAVGYAIAQDISSSLI